MDPQLILYHGKITTLAPSQPAVTAVAVADGWIVGTGSADELEIISLGRGI